VRGLDEPEREQLVTDALLKKQRKQVDRMDMPDIGKRHELEFHASHYRIFFIRDCNSLQGSFDRSSTPRYVYVLFVADAIRIEVLFYVTLERAADDGFVAREFDTKGDGQKIASATDWRDARTFLREALGLIEQRLKMPIAQGPPVGQR
jgi:hypothetical protein